MLKFIFIDFYGTNRGQVFSGAHSSPPGSVPTSISLPSPIFQEYMVSPFVPFLLISCLGHPSLQCPGSLQPPEIARWGSL